MSAQPKPIAHDPCEIIHDLFRALTALAREVESEGNVDGALYFAKEIMAKARGEQA